MTTSPTPTRKVANDFTKIMTALTLTKLDQKHMPKTPKNIAREFTNIMTALTLAQAKKRRH